MRALIVALSLILFVVLIPTGVVADDHGMSGDNQYDETTRGIAFVLAGMISSIIGGYIGKNIFDKSEDVHGTELSYLEFKNVILLSATLIVLGVVLTIGGLFHIM